jgi:uncharacterized membrane protein YesL
MDVAYELLCEAHFSIMNQLAVMRPYIKKHLQEFCKKKLGGALIMDTISFISLNLRLLASSPHNLVISWQTYDRNGCTFYTKAKDSTSQ